MRLAYLLGSFKSTLVKNALNNSFNIKEHVVQAQKADVETAAVIRHSCRCASSVSSSDGSNIYIYEDGNKYILMGFITWKKK